MENMHRCVRARAPKMKNPRNTDTEHRYYDGTSKGQAATGGAGVYVPMRDAK